MEDPIASSFPKPQRSTSQVHNCSLNQSANFVVSVLQTVDLKDFLEQRHLSVHCMSSESREILVDPWKFYWNQKRYILLWLCVVNTFSTKLVPFVQFLWASLCFCGCAGGAAHTASTTALYLSRFPHSFRIFPLQSLVRSFNVLQSCTWDNDFRLNTSSTATHALMLEDLSPLLVLLFKCFFFLLFCL